MKTYNVTNNLRMALTEVASYNVLPDNMPNIKLTKKQIEFVDALYFKYITRTIDNQGYEMPLYRSEMKEKWPSGPRVKTHEAKRFILNQLIELQYPNRISMKSDEAAAFFIACLNWRPFCQKVIKAAYQG